MMRHNVLGELLVLSTLVSCSKIIEAEQGKVVNKTFSAQYDEALTKVSIDAGGNAIWKDGDKIYWYTLNSSGNLGTKSGREDLTVGGESAEVHVEYTSGTDVEVYGYVLGGSASVTSGNWSKTSIKVTGGIQTTQTGKYADNTILKCTASIEDNIMRFKQIQSFICFRITTTAVGGTDYDNIRITSKDGRNIAGDVEYKMSTDGTPAIYGGSSGIVKVTNASSDILYVALLSGTYTSGLRIGLYDGDLEIAYVETATGFSLSPGGIADLGILDVREQVIGQKIPNIWPESAYIVWKGGQKMTKTIWAEYEPSDVTGITWTIKEGSGSIKEEGETTYDDTPMKYCIVEPSDTSTTIKVEAKLTGGKTEATKTCTITVGDFIDLGFSSGTLWAYSNLTGSAEGTVTAPIKGGLKLTPNYDDDGSYYMWGYCVNRDGEYLDKSASYTKWGGTSWSDKGGKYNGVATPAKVILDNADDAAWVCDNTWHIPSRTQANELKDDADEIGEVSEKGRGGVKMVSKIKGFTDVYVYFVYAGCIGKKPVNLNGSGYYTLNEVCAVDGQDNDERATMTAYEGAYVLKFNDVPVSGRQLKRFGGMPIRPVKVVSRSGDWETKYTKITH